MDTLSLQTIEADKHNLIIKGNRMMTSTQQLNFGARHLDHNLL